MTAAVETTDDSTGGGDGAEKLPLIIPTRKIMETPISIEYTTNRAMQDTIH